jgi:hypothetical protein
MAHRKRVSAYRRQGVSAFAYLFKLTSANRSRFTFCFRQNAKSEKLHGRRGRRIGVGGNVSADRRIGVSARGGSKHTHAVSGPDERFEQEGEPTRPRNVSDFPTRSPFQKNESERLAYGIRRQIPLPPNAGRPTRPRADTPTRSPSPRFLPRRYVSPDLPSGPY